MRAVTHVAFSDESNWNTGRYRSLGVISLPETHLQEIEQEIRSIITDSNINEFKWRKLDGAKERFAALKLCEFTVKQAYQKRLKIDVLIWDVKDNRHNVIGRDDVSNLHRMYYHLLKHVMRKRWSSESIWRLHPDEHSEMKWDELQYHLKRASTSISDQSSLFEPNNPFWRLKQEFGIHSLQPVSSSLHPLMQLIDLFAGLAVFSYEFFDQYQQWCNSSQQCLFDNEAVDGASSKRAQERFPVLEKFDKLCKDNHLYVSLRQSRGLKTKKPDSPINFWFYQPQHPNDKAPVRK